MGFISSLFFFLSRLRFAALRAQFRIHMRLRSLASFVGQKGELYGGPCNSPGDRSHNGLQHSQQAFASIKVY